MCVCERVRETGERRRRRRKVGLLVVSSLLEDLKRGSTSVQLIFQKIGHGGAGCEDISIHCMCVCVCERVRETGGERRRRRRKVGLLVVGRGKSKAN